MMNDMMGVGMWGMGFVWLLILVLVVLGIVALTNDASGPLSLSHRRMGQ